MEAQADSVDSQRDELSRRVMVEKEKGENKTGRVERTAEWAKRSGPVATGRFTR